MSIWVNSPNVTKSEYHRGQFEVNECTKILKNVEKVEKVVHEKYKLFIDEIRFTRLKDQLVHKPEFEPEIREVVNSSKDSYIYKILMNDFNSTIAKKIRIICDHLPEYL